MAQDPGTPITEIFTGSGNAGPSTKPGGPGNYDELERAEIAKDYGWALQLIYSVPELRKLFERAINAEKGVWSAEKFQAALMNTNWWRNNSAPAREAFALQAIGGQDWQDALDRAQSAVQARATEIGATLTPAQLEDLTRKYIFGGWSDPARNAELTKALSESIGTNTTDVGEGFLSGGAGDLQTQLMQIARRNGLELSESFYISAARSVASGLTTAEDWVRDIRSQAASLWPSFGDKIMAGMDAADMASGYVNTMSRVLEIDPGSIELSDPKLRAAMTQVDEQGNPKPVGLWDFEKQLRQDPRWQYTRNAHDEISKITGDIVSMFGFGG